MHYIARSIALERLIIIATFRSEEIRARLKGEPHPLAETLRLMAREDLFKEIRLQNLNQACVGRIAESMLGGSLDAEFVEKLSEESQGNPLFVVEALRMMYSQGALLRENCKWRLVSDSVGIPPKVKDIIMRRLEALRPSQRGIFDAASVIGEKFDPKVVADVLSQDNVSVLQSLRTVAQSTLLIFNEGDDYRFEHSKIQEMLYKEIPPPLKKEFHSRIASILEAKNQGSMEFPFSNVAYHYAQAGNKEKAIKYSLVAGQKALAKWSNVQAIEHFRYVLENVGVQQAEERRAALEGLGDAYAANCMYAEAIKTFDELAASETGALRLRAIRKAMDAAFIKGDKPDLLLDYAKKAEELRIYDRLEMARVLQNRGRAFAWASRGDASLDLADYGAALHIFEEENSLSDVAEALARDGEASFFYEEMYEKALGELLRSVALLRELGDFRGEIQATLRTAYGFALCGLNTEARLELSKVLREGERLSIFFELARARGILSLLAEGEGDYSKAISEVSKSMEYNQKADVIWIQGLNLGMLTRIYCKLGDLKRAEEYFERMTKLPPDVLSSGMVQIFVPLTNAVYFAAKGQWEESNRIFEKLGELGWKGFGDSYAWALEKQGRVEESKTQQLKAQKMHEESVERFRHANIQMTLLMPRVANIGDEVEVRLDLVNVGRNPGSLVRVDRLIPFNCNIVSMPPFCSAQNGSILFSQKSISDFEVGSIKLKVAFSKVGTFHINPCLVYMNDLGEAITRKTRPVILRAQLGTVERKQESAGTALQAQFEFKSQAAEKAFNYLIKAFREDYLSRRLPQENCGWRTLMEVVKNSGVTMYSIYGRCGGDGKAKLELERLGITESRFFQGERGRGGRVLKMRIRHENEIVKQRVGIPKS